MKHWLLILLLSASNALAFTFSGTHGTTGVYTCANGTWAEVQGAVDDAFCVAGDTILIPQAGGPWTWNQPLIIGSGGRTPKNIKIKGDTGTISSGNLARIVIAIPIQRAIDFTLEDGSGKTAEIGNLWIDGTCTDHKILLHGVTTVHQSGTTFSSGIRMHDVRFTVPYYKEGDIVLSGGSTVNGSTTLTVNNSIGADVQRAIFCNGVPTGTRVVAGSTATTIKMSVPATATASGLTVTLAGHIDLPNSSTYANASSGWLHLEDWVEGVVDHCEIDHNLMRYQAGFGLFNHNTSNEWSGGTPNGKGNYGDYAFFYKPNGNQNMAGTVHALFFEDLLIHAGCGAFTDTGTTTTGGGGIMVSRHNTRWAAFAEHGCRESSGRKRGGRLLECYNDLFILGTGLLETRFGNGLVEHRDGELVAYKDYLQGQGGLQAQADTIGPLTNMTKSSVYCTSSNNNGNVLGGGPDGLDPFDENQTGNFTDQFAGHAFSPLASYTHTQTDASIDTSGGVDQVNSGVDTDSRFGSVYGTVTGGTLSGSPAAGQTITGATVTIQGGGTIPADSLRNFVIRNPSVPRLNGQGIDANISFGRIVSNNQGTSGTASTLIQTEGTDIPINGHPPIAGLGTGTVLELRKVKNYMNVPGTGSQDVLASGSTASLSSGANRWVQSNPAGIWVWGLQRRSGNGGPWKDVTPLTEMTTGSYAGIVRDFHQTFGVASAVVKGGGSNIQGLFDRGYNWDSTIMGNSSHPETRVGASWSKQYLDHGVVIADTTPGNSFSPELASFYTDGAGGYRYPHPFVQAPAASVPVITNTTTAFTFLTGDPVSVTVVANGNPAPTFTMPTPGTSGVPSWLSLDSATGILSGTAAASGSPFTFTVTASNTPGAGTGTATKSFTFTVTTPTLNLTAPTDGTTLTAPADITLSASLSGTTGTVTFFDGATSLGSSAANPATKFLGAVPAGSYDYHAKFSALDSNHAAVTVSALPTPTPPAQILVKP